MTNFIVCADRSGNNDSACIDKVVEVLSKAGHNAEKAPVNSNSESLIWQGKADGKELVFLVNGSGIYTYQSVKEAVKSSGCNKAWFGFPRALAPGNEWITEDGLKNKKLTDEHDAGGFKTSSAYKEISNGGKFYTAAEYFEANSEYLGYAYGDTCEDVANMILNGSPGGSGGDDSSSEEGETQLMSGWESLCDLAKPYDGQAMLLVRGDTVVFRKIEIPEWTAIWAYEGVNVVDDSVTVKDYSPEIYNTIEVQYGDDYSKTIELCFERHKELFGERRKIIQATKLVTQEEYDAYMKQVDEKNKGNVEYEQSLRSAIENTVTGTVPEGYGQTLQEPVGDTHSTSTNYSFNPNKSIEDSKKNKTTANTQMNEKAEESYVGMYNALSSLGEAYRKSKQNKNK